MRLLNKIVVAVCISVIASSCGLAGESIDQANASERKPFMATGLSCTPEVRVTFRGGFDAELEAARSGQSSLADFMVGYRYYYGHGVPRDAKTADIYLLKAAAQGNAEAMYLLGLLNIQGFGVEGTERQAVDWFERAATGGCPEALVRLARIKGLNGDKEEALELRRRASETNSALGKASYAINLILEDGSQMALQEAHDLYYAALNQNLSYINKSNGEALSKVADYIQNIERREPKFVLDALKRAASTNNERSRYRLASMMWTSGLGTPAEAVTQIQLSACQYWPPAMITYATLLIDEAKQKGEGEASRTFDLAIGWLSVARVDPRLKTGTEKSIAEAVANIPNGKLTTSEFERRSDGLRRTNLRTFVFSQCKDLYRELG